MWISAGKKAELPHKFPLELSTIVDYNMEINEDNFRRLEEKLTENSRHAAEAIGHLEDEVNQNKQVVAI